MMNCVKKSFLCDSKMLGLSWAKTNVMTPLPYLRKNGELRVFLTMCDADNVGRCGYIDLNPADPFHILRVSMAPVLDIGERGMFDEHGVLPTSLLRRGENLYLYYSAYQRQATVPYTILSGLAVSSDDGDSFMRMKSTPLLDRCPGQEFQRSAIEVMERDGAFHMWYTAGCGWQDIGGHIVPRYDLEYLRSDKFDEWCGQSVVSLSLAGDEYGLTMPQVWVEDGIYKMIYSIRSISKGYRIGYAESVDGIVFERLDDRMNIDVSSKGFDSEMICFGKLFRSEHGKYLFYCGNHYGRGGLGCAEMI